MNINELDAYNLDDAVKFNDRLNPKLWDSTEHLKPEVKAQLLRIAEDFREFLGVTDLDLQDITISGSNAAYTYTPNSDIDLHLVVNMPADEVYRELFDAKKFQYNEQHNITIGGYDVELYVQDADQPHISQGIYSILNDNWIQVPRRVKSVVDDTSTEHKFKTVGHQIEKAIASGSLTRMTRMAEKIKKMRQTGLEQHGEFGPENLAFKMLRKQGKIKELYDARNRAKDHELSLKEKAPPVPFKYGFQTPEPKIVSTVAESTPEVPSDEEILKDFIRFCVAELKIKAMPVVKLRRDPQWSVRNKTFGRYINDHDLLEVAWGQRHIMDVLRTVAHELTHRHQHERESVPTDAGETGSPYENEANARAGVLMRDYARLHPNYFAVGQAENLKEGVERNYLWHGSTQKIPVLTPRQAHDTGGAPGSNQNAIYATADKNTAIKMGMAERGSDTAMFDQADQLVLFSGRLRRGKNVYLHQLPRYDANGQDMWLPGGNGNEFYTKPEVKELKPLRIIPTPVDSHLSLVRKPTAKDLKLQKKYSKQGVAEGSEQITELRDRMYQYIKSIVPTWPDYVVKDWLYKGGKTDTKDNIIEQISGAGLTPNSKWQLVPNMKFTMDMFDPMTKQRLVGRAGGTSDLGMGIPKDKERHATQAALAQQQGGVRKEPVLLIKTAKGYELLEGWHRTIQHFAKYPEGYTGPAYVAVAQGQQGVAEGASGYIPTKKQAKDPRFSMALTQDIRPGQLGKEANKLKLKTNKQGVPQVANPNGLFEKLALELNQFKRKSTLAESTEQLDEVKMSPSALMSWARSPEAQGIRAGFEAELIFRDATNNGDSDYEMEPDYDMDERCRTIQQVMDFFSNGEYGGLSDRQQSRLQDDLDESYMNWLDDEMRKAFRDEQEDLIKKVLVDEGDWDLDNEIQKQLALLDLTDDEMNAIINAGERAPKFTSSKEQILYAEANPLYDKYLDAQKEAEGLLDELVQDSIRAEDKFYDAALEDFRDSFYLDDDSGFFDDTGNRWMSDIASNYDLDWPYMTGGGGNDGSRDWESIGDSLHDTIDMPVKVSSGYHNATRKEGLWIVEPDTSLEPDDREDFGLEIVSPPMPLLTALEKLQEVCDWANDSSEGNAYTNGSTGLHMGVSVPFKGGDVDYLKLILFLGDEYVLRSFGREANTYCKSAMSKFKENIKGGRADPMGVIKLMQSGLLELAHREIQKGVGDGKYTSAHIQDGYIEFRSPGGDWLAEESADPEKLTSTMLRFARAMSLAANPAEERREYAKKLYKLVAPEGDSELALFSQFASGELTAEQLKKRWAEKTIGTEKKMNQRWRLYQKVDGVWEPVPGAEWNGYPESEVKNRVWAKYGREALDTGEYQLVNMGEQDWEVYDVKTGKTLEIVKGKSKGEVADQVYDKYVDQGIGFQVRAWEDPATMTPRAKLAKQIAQAPAEKPAVYQVVNRKTGEIYEPGVRGTKSGLSQVLRSFEKEHKIPQGDAVLKLAPNQDDKQPEPTDYNYEIVNLGDVNLGVVDKFYADSKQEADKTFDKWLEMKGLPNDTDTYGYRPRKQEAAKDPAVQDTNVDVAQNFAQPQNATDRVGSWAIYDVTLGREISRMDNVPWQQASDRADELERSTGHNMSVRGLSENITEGLSQNQSQVRQTLNAWMNQDQQFKDPTQRAGFQAKVWPYIQKNINSILSDKGQDGKGSYPAAPYAAWLLVQHMDAYPQNQASFLSALEQSGLDPTDGDGKNIGKLQFLRDRLEVNKWIAANANNKEYYVNGKPLPNPTVNVRNPAIFKDAGQVATSRKDALDNAIAAGNKLLVAAVQATKAQTQPSYKQTTNENFADGKGPGRPGDSQRHGIPKGATIAQLEKASHSAGRKGQLARWQLNMRRGKKK